MLCVRNQPHLDRRRFALTKLLPDTPKTQVRDNHTLMVPS